MGFSLRKTIHLNPFTGTPSTMEIPISDDMFQLSKPCVQTPGHRCRRDVSLGAVEALQRSGGSRSKVFGGVQYLDGGQNMGVTQNIWFRKENFTKMDDD